MIIDCLKFGKKEREKKFPQKKKRKKNFKK